MDLNPVPAEFRTVESLPPRGCAVRQCAGAVGPIGGGKMWQRNPVLRRRGALRPNMMFSKSFSMCGYTFKATRQVDLIESVS